MIASLAVIVLLVVVAICLVAGIRVLAHDAWTRLAWAVVRLSRAAPGAGEFLACLGDYLAAWLAVRGIKDAPRAERRKAAPPFGPAPEPQGPDPAAARADDPSAAEVTTFDIPPALDRPFVDEPPFGAAVAAAMTMTRSRP